MDHYQQQHQQQQQQQQQQHHQPQQQQQQQGAAGVTGAASAGNSHTNVVDQVAQAALAMVRPHTDAATRAAASAFLEKWTRTTCESSWHVYSLWLHESLSCLARTSLLQHATTAAAAATAKADSPLSLQEAVGMILLCLQLLQGKIRREVLTVSSLTSSTSTINNNNTAQDLEHIQGELLHLQSSLASAPSLTARPILTSASICLAALVVRKNMGNGSSGGFTHFIQQCLVAAAQCYNAAPALDTTTNNNNNNNDAMLLSPSVAFSLLTNIPLEVESAATPSSCFQSSQQDALIIAELRAHVENVFETCCRALVVSQQQQQQHAQNTEHQAIGQYAMETLLQWTKTCRVCLAHFNTPLPTAATAAATIKNSNDTTVAVLPLLIHMLSLSSSQQQVNGSERVLVLASRALTEAILIPDDDRSAAVHTILQAIATTGFIAAPLHQATANAWEDATHALVVLLCTFCTEEVDAWCCTSSSIVNGKNDTHVVHALLEVLLQVQNHPNIKICCLVRSTL
jgi:hypothetical protein